MKNNTKLQKSWVWNSTVEKLVRKYIKGFSLNVCCGNSNLGDVKVDMDPQDENKNNLLFYLKKDQKIINGDMNKLPFEDNTFDTVIEDPPWKIGFYQRMKPFFECTRVCKPGGIIIYNAYWIPQSKLVTLKEVIVRQDTEWSNCSIISIFKKNENTSRSI